MTGSWFDCRAGTANRHQMNDALIHATAPPGWLEAFARSDTQLAADQRVFVDAVMGELRESTAGARTGGNPT